MGWAYRQRLGCGSNVETTEMIKRMLLVQATSLAQHHEVGAVIIPIIH